MATPAGVDRQLVCFVAGNRKVVAGKAIVAIRRMRM
jgi:hypothetical protein